MSDNIEVLDPQGIGSPGVTPSTPGVGVDPSVSAEAGQQNVQDATSAAATDAKADAKAAEQTKNCSGGKCGTQVPGQCCEWMSKFNIACQKGLRPYTNSCSNCGGSGDKGGSPCQACDGTGLEGSTGGGLGLSAMLIKLKNVITTSDLADTSTKFRHLSVEAFLLATRTQFDSQWKGHYLIPTLLVKNSVTPITLNALYKLNGRVINVNSSGEYQLSNLLVIYFYDNDYYVLQSDLKVEFPQENF